MKKLALALCLLAVSFTAQAQFEKGTTIINPSLSGLDFSYSKNDKAKFGVGAQVGTFFAEGIALMVNAGADWSKPVDEYTLGTGVRFYFNKTGIYLGGGLDWNPLPLEWWKTSDRLGTGYRSRIRLLSFAYGNH